MDTIGRSDSGAEWSVTDIGDSNRNVGAADGCAAAPKLVSRAESREKGLKRYFTGKPCAKGHVAERSLSTGKCVVCHNLRSQKWSKKNPGYAPKWREENPDRVAKYRENNLQYIAKWHDNHPEWMLNRKSERQATRAAKLLTEMLGVPHKVTRQEDGTFQPVPITKGEVP
jgi:hypothetical protein